MLQSQRCQMSIGCQIAARSRFDEQIAKNIGMSRTGMKDRNRGMVKPLCNKIESGLDR